MRVTMRTNIAMRALMYCAVNPGQIVRKSEIAEACNASENHLAQVVNQLARLGILNTLRGRGGGITLNKPAEEVSVGSLFRALEGGLPLAECFTDARNTCPIADCCRLQGALARAQEAFYEALDEITLADLVGGNVELTAILGHGEGDAAPRPMCLN